MIQEIPIPKPHDAQYQVLGERKRFNVLDCGRRWGKSKLAIRLMTQTSFAKQPVGYFTPTYKLLEGTFKECYEILKPLISRKHDNQFIELKAGGGIEFWSLDNPYAGRSRKYKLIVVDEAAFTKDLWEIWTKSLRPTLTDLKGEAWFMSTPRGKNDFFKLFMKGKGGEDNWASWKMSTYTNPYIDHAELEDAKKDLPVDAFQQEYMAEFNENSANPFGYAYIQQCTFPITNLAPVCFGIDLAKSHDWTVIIGLDKDGAVCYFERFQKDWRQTTQTILNLPNIPMVIDSTGVGDPIAEEISRLRDVQSFKFTSQSKQQIMEGLALAIQKRHITFPDGQIKDELENFEYQYTKSGVRYSAPEGLTDDCVCALALAVIKFRTAAQSGQYCIV